LEVAIAVVEVAAYNSLVVLRDGESLLWELAKDLDRDRCNDYERFDSHFGWLFPDAGLVLKERPIVGHSRFFFKRNQWVRISTEGYNNKENRSA
jgi:hypothetical protein